MTLRMIDLNADLGEFAERLADGSDAELMRYITSANVACGGHAGDAFTMEQTMELARQHHVSAGAHPSYPDRTGFGRVSLPMPAHQLQDSIAEQISGLLAIARRVQIPLKHVKPHGALYHSCNRDAEIALSFARAVLSIDRAGKSITLRLGDFTLPKAQLTFDDEHAEQDDGRQQQRRREPAFVLKQPRRRAASRCLRERALRDGFAYRHRHFLCGRRERVIARLDLARMDQRLAVEAELVGLAAFGGKTVGIAEVVVDAVQDVEAVGAGGGDAAHQPRQHRRAARHDPGAGVLGEVVGAHDEAGQPGLGIERGGGDLADIEHRQRRLHHGPDPHARIGAHVDDARRQVLQLARRRNLRHQQGVGPRRRGGVEILDPPADI